MSAELSCLQPPAHTDGPLPPVTPSAAQVELTREIGLFCIFSVFSITFLGLGAGCCSLVAPEPVPSPLQECRIYMQTPTRGTAALQDHLLPHHGHLAVHAVLSLTGWQAGLVAEFMQLRETRHLGTMERGCRCELSNKMSVQTNRSHTPGVTSVFQISAVSVLLNVNWKRNKVMRPFITLWLCGGGRNQCESHNWILIFFSHIYILILFPKSV